MNKLPVSVIDRSLISLTWPIFIDIFFVFMVSVTDAWFLSQISDTAAAAAGAVMPLLGLGFTLFFNLSLAGSNVAAQKIGAGQIANLANTYGAILLLAALLGVCVSGTFAISSSLLAGWMGLQGDMKNFGAEYLKVMGYGAFFLAIRHGANGILTANGMTKWNMCSTAIMTLLNTLFNYMLAFGHWGAPALGLAGIAIASCLAWALSLLFSLAIILFVARIKVKLWRGWAAFKHGITPVLKLGIPSVMEPLSWHLSQLLIIAMVVQLGEFALATRVYAYNILFVVALFATALSAGVQLKIAHLVGAKRFDDADRQMRQGLTLGIVGVLVLVASLLISSKFLLGLFTQNAAIIVLGQKIIAIAFFCEVGRMLNLITGASLKASGDAKYISVVGFLVMWLIAVPCAWLLGIYFAWGLVGIWIAMSLDELIRGAAALLRWRAGTWRAKGLFAKGGDGLAAA